MKFGLFLVTQYDLSFELAEIPRTLRERVRSARDLGFEGVYVGEHHATDSHHYLLNEATLAYLAGFSGDLTLGTFMTLLPLHNPVRIAEYGATMDVLTGGRFRLGVAIGYRPQEFHAFGVDRREAPARLREGLEIIEQLWTRDRVTYHGDHFELNDVSIRPQPLQRPRPPIWVGASNETSIRRAARVSDGWMGAHVPFDLAREQAAVFRDERERAGRKPGEVGLIREVFVAETSERAEQLVRDPLMNKYSSYTDWEQDRVIRGDEFASAWDQLKNQRFLVGDPPSVIRDLRSYEETVGLDYLMVRTQFPGFPPEHAAQSLELFGREVLPEFE